jgi:imidazolonepropionase-like amidohydrolase
MSNFKRVSLVGSEDLFRPTRPQVVEGTDEVIKESVDRPGVRQEKVVLKTLGFTPDEIELLLEAVQTAKYPDRARAKPALDKFDALDALRLKIQEVAGG